MSNSQITYDLDYAEERSRLTTFFRLLLAIPLEIFLVFYLIAAYIAVFFAWFVLLFTAHYPAGIYNFAAGAVRMNARVSAYVYLGLDPYPPFGGGEHPEYPMRIDVQAPLEKYSRVKVFFLYFYLIPIQIVSWAMSIVAGLCAFASWFVILFTGKQPQGLQDALKLALSYQARVTAVGFMLKQYYPPISAEAAESGSVAAGGPAAPAGGPEAPSIGI